MVLERERGAIRVSVQKPGYFEEAVLQAFDLPRVVAKHEFTIFASCVVWAIFSGDR